MRVAEASRDPFATELHGNTPPPAPPQSSGRTWRESIHPPESELILELSYSIKSICAFPIALQSVQLRDSHRASGFPHDVCLGTGLPPRRRTIAGYPILDYCVLPCTHVRCGPPPAWAVRQRSCTPPFAPVLGSVRSRGTTTPMSLALTPPAPLLRRALLGLRRGHTGSKHPGVMQGTRLCGETAVLFDCPSKSRVILEVQWARQWGCCVDEPQQ